MIKAFLSTLLAWGASVASMVFGFIVVSRSESPGISGLRGILESSISFGCIAGVYVGIVVFPTCFLVVAPLLILLPRSSPLWKPAIATCIGAVAGPLGLYLLSAVFTQGMFLSDIPQSLQVALAGVAAIAGATFAFSYARMKQS